MNNIQEQKNGENELVTSCKPNLKKYFHPINISLSHRFKTLYDLFKLNDGKVARAVGIDGSTMSRYRRGIFYPTSQMKLLIAQAISKLADYPVDSAVIWGDDLFFEEWKNKKEGENERAI